MCFLLIESSGIMEKHQQRAIEALEQLKTICDTNGIRMILLAGTALGAVRIPWDDDVDVGFFI